MKPRDMSRGVKRDFVWILVCLLLYVFSVIVPTGLAADEEWKAMADMPTARSGLATSVVDGRIYAIGGSIGNETRLSAVEEYNPATDTWTRMADMPTIRGSLSTSAVNGKIYAIGGRSGGPLKTVEEYDPLTDTWEEKKDISIARLGIATCVVEGKIYAIGGGTDNADYATVEEYDPLMDTWIKKANMPTARFGLTAGVVDGKIYAIGGSVLKGNQDTPVTTVEEYDPLTDTWTKKNDMPEEFAAWGKSCVVNGKIYVFGGLEGVVSLGGGGPAVGAIATVRCYDPATDTWMKKMDMPFPRNGMAVSAVKGKIYVIGGNEGRPAGGADLVVLDAVEEYTPEGWPFAVFPREKLVTTWGSIKRSRR